MKIKENLTNQELNTIDQGGSPEYDPNSGDTGNRDTTLNKYPFLKKLKFLGEGASRAVFLYNNKWIIKIGVGEYGRLANESEVKIYNDFRGEDYNLLAEVIEYGDNYVFIIMEKVNMFKSDKQMGNFIELNDPDGEWDIQINRLVQQGLPGDDLHFKNMGYIGNQLKIVDYQEIDL